MGSGHAFSSLVTELVVVLFFFFFFFFFFFLGGGGLMHNSTRYETYKTF